MRCRLRGSGGSIVVAPADDDEHEVGLELVTLLGPQEPSGSLTGRLEGFERTAGHKRLRFSSSSFPRRLLVEGSAVTGCAIAFDDGHRRSGCDQSVPADSAGTLSIEHERGPVRALLERKEALASARIGVVDGGDDWQPGQAAPLAGALFVRRVTVETDGVLRMVADAGTCAVVSTAAPASPLVAVGDAGCDVHVPVARGTYRVAVRAFADVPLTGSARWAFVPLVTLGEGRGDEVQALPGEARFFRLSVQGDGTVGLGVQVDSDVLTCALLDSRGDVVVDGCQVFVPLKKGAYTWRLSVTGERPRRFRPVVFGLKGAEVDVPDEWLRAFFARVPPPISSSSSSSSSSQSEVR
jgi:hypothetical protein